MRFEATSAPDALIFNGMPEHVVNPWTIIVDSVEETITVKKRNWHLVGKDEQTLSFRFIRSIKIDQHMFGADIHIKIMGGTISAFGLRKSDTKRVKEILLEYNSSKRGKGIIFA
ncbi:MAG: hypothetical protein K9J13_16665 [Saprospiraceae bacterium]|nr:hypothetical protein [Melioribacteraceae bacterium]MCF8299183.1 hypothetical protein [Saprospiraceae bacterium]